MIKVSINTDRIVDWDSFHDIFSETFRFPEFYGRNMEAWIDCMSKLHHPIANMGGLDVDQSDSVIIELLNSFSFVTNHPKIFNTLLECTTFANKRFIENKSREQILFAFL